MWPIDVEASHKAYTYKKDWQEYTWSSVLIITPIIVFYSVLCVFLWRRKVVQLSFFLTRKLKRPFMDGGTVYFRESWFDTIVFSQYCKIVEMRRIVN